MVDLNPNIKFAFDDHEDGAILYVYVPPESTGYPEWVKIGLDQSTLLDLNLDLDLTPISCLTVLFPLSRPVHITEQHTRFFNLPALPTIILEF